MDMSVKLRINLRSYQNLVRQNKQALASTYIPIIRQCCEALSLDWEVIIGIKNGYFNKELSVPEMVKKPEIAVLSGFSGNNNCEICGKQIIGKRSDAKVCSKNCKRLKKQKK